MNPVVAFPLTERQVSRSGRAARRPSLGSAEYKPVQAIRETIDWRQPEPSKSPSPDAVRTQLSKILQSDGFVNARRMRRFLKFVVEETLAGRGSQLCEYSIGLSVFERDESFEPGLDPIVRNDARRLRQKLFEYYRRSRDNGDEQVVLDIPKGGYVPVFTFASPPQDSSNAGQYRLTVNLIRLEDATEICAKQYDFEGCEGFTMHLEVKTHAQR